jgi:hypothetical protein
MLVMVRHQCCVPEAKLWKSWRRVGERSLAVMSDYAAVEMEQVSLLLFVSRHVCM